MATSIGLLLEKGQKQNERNTVERRKTYVTGIKGKVSSAADGNISDINSKIDALAGKIESAIKGISAVGTLTGEFDGKKEPDSASDTNLSSFDSNLASEISDCDSKISDLDTQISSLQSRYETALNDEKEAAKKALEQVFV